MTDADDRIVRWSGYRIAAALAVETGIAFALALAIIHAYR